MILPHLDRCAGTPLHQQIAAQVRRLVDDGTLVAGAALPSSRSQPSGSASTGARSARPTRSCGPWGTWTAGLGPTPGSGRGPGWWGRPTARAGG